MAIQRKKRFYFLFLISLSLIIISCAPTTKIKKEVGMLNLTYEYREPVAKKTGLSIAIVSPQIVRGKSRESDFSHKFYSEYADKVRLAFKNAFEEVITKKGFNLMGPFNTFYDMTYEEKKMGYLALIPMLDMKIDKKRTNIDCKPITNICIETGVIQIGGEFKISFVEPLTKETILNKRINLYDFGIEKEYIREYKTIPAQQSGTTTLTLTELMTAGTELIDNTDKALTEALNEFFSKSMEKIVRFISTEEIVSYKKQIKELKRLKRF